MTASSFVQYLLLTLFFCAIALARDEATPEVIAYVFVMNRALQPNEIAADKLTRINYAFANLKNGEMVEGFSHDAENFATLNSLKSQEPPLEGTGFRRRMDLVRRLLGHGPYPGNAS